MSNTQIDPRRFPTFLLVGANKGGTTSIHTYLNQHPQIEMSSVKEPMFFTAELAKNYRRKRRNMRNRLASLFMSREQRRKRRALGKVRLITTIKEYQALFSGDDKIIARGEASTNYLTFPDEVIRNVRKYTSDMKILACLRDPLQRLLSAYRMLNGASIEKRPLRRILEGYVKNPTGHNEELIRASMYGSNLARYQEAFGKDNCLFLPYEMLDRAPGRFIQNVFEFLGVDPSFKPDVTRRLNPSTNWVHNESKVKSCYVLDDDDLSEFSNIFEDDLRVLSNIVDFNAEWLVRQ